MRRERLPYPTNPPPLTPAWWSRDVIIVDDANVATDEDILLAKIRLHLMDTLGTITR